MNPALPELHERLKEAQLLVQSIQSEIDAIEKKDKAEAIAWIKQQMKEYSMTLEDVRSATQTRLRWKQPERKRRGSQLTLL